QGVVEPSPLPLAQPVELAEADVAAPVRRAAFAAAMAIDVLLQPPADFVHGAESELDDVERVEDSGGVLELVVDGALVAVERMQRGDLDAAGEALATCGEPVSEHQPRPARHQVQQSGLDVPGCIAGEVDHPGQLFRAAFAPGDVMPNVLVDSERADAVEAGRIIGQGLQRSPDRGPDGLPGGAELAGQPVDGGVLSAQLLDCPIDDPGGGGVPRPGERGELLDEGAAFARGAGADEAALAPQDRHRPPERGDVDQTHQLPSMTGADGAAIGAPDRPWLRFDAHLQMLATQTRIKHVHVVETDEALAAGPI